jgi:alpha-galactosidase
MHRRLWLNDPDCLMLRTADTSLEPAAVRAWAHAVALSGGMALVSDDLARLDDAAHGLLDEVVQLGRASDDAARGGASPRCDDLMADALVGRLSAIGRTLTVDPATGRATFGAADGEGRR